MSEERVEIRIVAAPETGDAMKTVGRMMARRMMAGIGADQIRMGLSVLKTPGSEPRTRVQHQKVRMQTMGMRRMPIVSLQIVSSERMLLSPDC